MSINTGDNKGHYAITGNILPGDLWLSGDGLPLNTSVALVFSAVNGWEGYSDGYKFWVVDMAGLTTASVWDEVSIYQFTTNPVISGTTHFESNQPLPANNHFYGGFFDFVYMAQTTDNPILEAMEAAVIEPADETYATLTKSTADEFTCRVSRRFDKTNIFIQMEK